MNFDEKLVAARKSKGLSQERLAEIVGVSRQAVSKWETGDAQPDFAKLVALADALELSIDEMCGRETVICSRENSTEDLNGGAKNPPKGSLVLRIVSFAIAAVIIFAFGTFVGTRIAKPTLENETAVTGDAEDFYVNGLKFVRVADTDNVNFHFLPSIFGEGYTYRMKISDGREISEIAVECRNGKCAGKLTLVSGRKYSLTLIASDGKNEYSVKLTDTLRLGPKTVLWD